MSNLVEGIWARALPPNNFFNIERSSAAAPPGGGGALYIEVPSSVVPSLLQLLGRDAASIPDELPIETAVVGDPGVSAPLVWRSKTGKRMRLFQNRQSGPDVRHPAWRSERGFPSAPDNVISKEEAASFIENGLRVYVVRTEGERYFAGFLVGDYPDSWPAVTELRTLLTGPGGVRFFTGGLYLDPESADQPFRTTNDAAVGVRGGIIDGAIEADSVSGAAAPSVFPYASPATAREVDRVAMDLALEWAAVEFPNAAVARMPHNNPGYDILVVENGEPTRYIEVKGTQLPVPRFYLSENERQFSADNSGLYTMVIFYAIDLDAETGIASRHEGEVTGNAANLRVVQWQGRLDAAD